MLRRFSRSHKETKSKNKHFKWTPLEDELLIRIVSNMKPVDWDKVSNLMGNRNVRQCKDRWNYYLSPDVNNGEWTEEEDNLLREKVKEFGTKWKIIASFFTGRTNTNFKNRFLAMKREKMNETKKGSKH